MTGRQRPEHMPKSRGLARLRPRSLSDETSRFMTDEGYAVRSRAGEFEMRRWTMRHVIEGAKLTLQRLEQLGRVPPGNRLTRALHYLGALATESSTVGPVALDQRHFSEAVRTAFEFFFIVRALDAEDSLAHERVLVALGGADLPEEDRTTTARDAQFELLVTALLRLGGIIGVRLGEPDIRIPAGNEAIGVAVKRLTSPKQLTKRMRKAIQQVRGQGQRGIVVVSLDAFAAGTSIEAMEEIAFSTTLRCRNLVEELRGGDAVFGVLGIAAGFFSPDGEDGAALGIRVSQHLQLIAPEHEHGLIQGRVGQIADNLAAGIARETFWLEDTAF